MAGQGSTMQPKHSHLRVTLRKDIKNILTNQTTAISMCFVLIPQDLESLSLISRLKT
jgi:hypothetical protein